MQPAAASQQSCTHFWLLPMQWLGQKLPELHHALKNDLPAKKHLAQLKYCQGALIPEENCSNRDKPRGENSSSDDWACPGPSHFFLFHLPMAAEALLQDHAKALSQGLYSLWLTERPCNCRQLSLCKRLFKQCCLAVCVVDRKQLLSFFAPGSCYKVQQPKF